MKLLKAIYNLLKYTLIAMVIAIVIITVIVTGYMLAVGSTVALVIGAIVFILYILFKDVPPITKE